jgi:2-dehydro-3-deoxygluconokinase
MRRLRANKRRLQSNKLPTRLACDPKGRDDRNEEKECEALADQTPTKGADWPKKDVMLGNEEDFTAALGFKVEGVDEHFAKLDVTHFRRMIEQAVLQFPNFEVVATTLRAAKTATRNDWGAVCYSEGQLFQAPTREDLEIFDRVGGGDSFASGLIFGFLTDKGPQWAVDCGAAHGALAMTTPGDTSMTTIDEVLQAMEKQTVRISR